MRNISVVVAAVGESAIVSRLGRVQVTRQAITDVVARSPRVPVLRGHDGTAVGWVTGWSLSRNGTDLIAHCEVRDEAGAHPGQAASIECTFDNRRLADDGEWRVSTLGIDGLALLPTGKRGAFRSARVIEVRPGRSEVSKLPVGAAAGAAAGAAPRQRPGSELRDRPCGCDEGFCVAHRTSFVTARIVHA